MNQSLLLLILFLLAALILYLAAKLYFLKKEFKWLELEQENNSQLLNKKELKIKELERNMALRYLVWVIQMAYININGNAKLKISMNAV